MAHITQFAALDNGTDILIEEALCTFEVDFEIVPAEPYSWGGGRGEEVVITSVKLIGAHVAGKFRSRAEIIDWFGEKAVKDAEKNANFDDVDFLEAA